VPEVCGIFCATANPVQVIVVQTDLGRGILGVIDGQSPLGVEDDAAAQQRKVFLRTIGYKQRRAFTRTRPLDFRFAQRVAQAWFDAVDLVRRVAQLADVLQEQRGGFLQQAGRLGTLLFEVVALGWIAGAPGHTEVPAAHVQNGVTTI
jgi:hypothetical protein